MRNNDAAPEKRRSGMVRVRGGFSDSNGIALCNTTLQFDEFDNASRIQMNNELYSFLEALFDGHISGAFDPSMIATSRVAEVFCRDVLNDVFCDFNVLGSDYQRHGWRFIYVRLSDVVLHAEFNEVLDAIQYCCQWFDKYLRERSQGIMSELFNTLFEKEYIGYRFVDGKIVAITDKQEIEAIEEACSNPYDGCRAQIEKALGFLSDRENPDYKNSIKESISAVESICQIVTGNDKASLGDALRQLESRRTIHPTLKTAFTKLYGYASDQGGIRHAEGMFESDVTFEEAKFMLVACSAFINYMIAEQGKGSN